MRKTALIWIFSISGILSIQAQSPAGSSDNLSIWITLILIVVALLALLGDAFYRKRSKAPTYASGGHFVGLNKGFDLHLKGGAEDKIIDADHVTRYAVLPPNFRGNNPIPKMEVNEGDEVKAGDVLFHDKSNESIKYVAPVSGEVIAINRGEKRSIVEVVILADKVQKHRELPVLDLTKADRAALVDYLKAAGFWPLINQRPFDIIPDPEVTPKNIFISTFDTAPLAPDLNLIVAGQEAEFQQGLDVLARLTDGQVHLGLSANGTQAPHQAFTQAKNVKKTWFKGLHPAGNVGIQIHHIDPIKNGDVVWTLGVQEVITLGKLILNHHLDLSRIVALTGSELKSPHYVRTSVGANLGELLANEVEGTQVRIISGDVLSGEGKKSDGFLNIHDDQVTVIPEGDYYDLFGWLTPGKAIPSLSHTYLNAWKSNKTYTVDTNTHGEKRAFVVTGQFEKVLPMNIYPQHLMKSILAGDLEKMEGLGILELSEEDIALCEYVCTSKTPLQKILREGLDALHEQG